MKTETSYNYELIKDYLDGLLESEAALKIERLIETDEDAKAIAEGILILQKNSSDDEGVEEYLDQRMNTLQKKITQQPANTAPKRTFQFVKIAASITLFVASGLAIYLSTKPELQDLVEDHLEIPYQASVATRGADALGAGIEGLDAFNDKRYQEALDILASQNAVQANFFAGLSLLYLDRANEAIKILNNAQFQESRFEEQSRWYLALAYLKTEEPDQGEKLLLRIKHTEGHYKQKEALEILEFLTD